MFMGSMTSLPGILIKVADSLLGLHTIRSGVICLVLIKGNLLSLVHLFITLFGRFYGISNSKQDQDLCMAGIPWIDAPQTHPG
jgi:hypothetical protein